MRPGEGITGRGRGRARAGDDRRRRRTSTRASSRSRTCPRTSTSRSSPCRSSRGSSSRARSTSARASRASSRAAEIELLRRDRRAGRAVDRAREALRAGAAARRRARGAGADLGGGLRVALPRGVARGDRRRRRWTRSTRRAPRSCSRTARSPGRRAAPARTRCACRCAGSGRQIGELVCDRDTPFTDDDRALLASIAHHAAVALEHGRAVMRGVLAQEIHHRVKNNLQTVASLLRLQARADDVDARKALEDSVNRILAIAAVHEVLTERRDDDVDLGELLDRLRAMLVQGLGAGEGGRGVARAGLAGRAAARPRSRSSSRELLQNALEHGGDVGADRARAAERRRRARDRRRRRRASTASRSRERASRSCARSSATSCGGTLALESTAGCAPRSCSRPERSWTSRHARVHGSRHRHARTLREYARSGRRVELDPDPEGGAARA